MDKATVIRATGVGKSYVIGHQSIGRHATLRDAIARGVGNIARLGRAALRNQPMVSGDTTEEFWALQGLGFEISRGEVVGVIGRNGAGKSTLLKVLSRITEPTTGRVEINGRVASLLEVGTGFHPELSGRENIFLNGAILGMSRAEIRSKFDEIVAFSEVERFLDTPVKRYSSGMYVRLAFAVAAHLEPEILIVDEVLAVGDAEFQKKCLGKMQDVAHAGRTVLFVSHNLGTIGALCHRGIVLQNGCISYDGPIGNALATYTAQSASSVDFRADPAAIVGKKVHFAKATVMHTDRGITVEAQVQAKSGQAVLMNARIRDSYGAPLGMASLGGFDPEQMVMLASGCNAVRMQVDLPDLANGNYLVDLDLEEPYGHFLDRVEGRLNFEILRTPAAMHGRVLLPDWGVGSLQFAARTAATVMS